MAVLRLTDRIAGAPRLNRFSPAEFEKPPCGAKNIQEGRNVKKLLKGTLCLALLCALCLASASAATAAPTPIQSGDYWYILHQEGSAEITKYTGKEETLLIPSELDGHPVTGIGDYAFSDRRSLTSVTIPDSVTSIGDDAFGDCRSLTSVTIPDSVTSIGDDAFSRCPDLTLTVPWGGYAAKYCKENRLRYTYSDALDWLNN